MELFPCYNGDIRKVFHLSTLLATEVIMKGEIANPHWNACDSCGHLGKHGCNLSHIDLSVHLGDFILCDDFVEANKSNQPDGYNLRPLLIGKGS